MTSDSLPRELRLVAEPAEWDVTLRSGEKLRVLAHGYSIEGSEYVFSFLMEGSPPFELHILRLPTAMVDSVFGG